MLLAVKLWQLLVIHLHVLPKHDHEATSQCDLTNLLLLDVHDLAGKHAILKVAMAELSILIAAPSVNSALLILSSCEDLVAKLVDDAVCEEDLVHVETLRILNDSKLPCAPKVQAVLSVDRCRIRAGYYLFNVGHLEAVDLDGNLIRFLM